jgi:hypothetical protein
MFVIFGVLVDDAWVSIPDSLKLEELDIYNINMFPRFVVDIDFNAPHLAQNKMVELTEAVESQCPVAYYFGNNGVGEGIVFTCDTDKSLRFKSKGEKHSVSKVKTLNPVDVEKLENVKQFVEMVVPDPRLEQGISYLKEQNLVVDQTSTKHFLSWVWNDVMKEEVDTMVENGLDPKAVRVACMTHARKWFFDYLNAQVM